MNSGPPSVVVQRAPDGWTHIGGPGMHLLIALEEEDDLTLIASDAADGGDLDDVIDVLTAGGMRRAHHFVGVHWLPTTRIVAFGPVVATVTFADGTEREVRADGPRVWRNVDLDEVPERVELRVLDEQERTEPATSSSAQSVSPQASSSAQSVSPQASSSVQNLRQSPPPTVPTFGSAPSDSSAPAASRWGSWARPPEPPTSEPQQSDEPPEAPPPASSVQEVRAVTAHSTGEGGAAGAVSKRDVLPSWGPGPAVAPRRAEPTASDLPARTPAPPADVESTWTARPGRTEIEERTAAAPIAPSTPGHDVDGPALPPSYDYLFGHTVTVDEHQRLLAGIRADSELESELDSDSAPELEPEPEAADEHPLGWPVSPAPAAPDASGESTPSQPAGPGTAPVRDSAASASGGGLISSVPWATGAAGTVPAAGPDIQPQPRQDVPTFSGRRTPPPAPSLLPPLTPAPSPVDAGAPAVSAGEPPVDADEQTVDRSALIDARRTAREGATAGPSVLAVLCSAGHPTPPHADSCRLCGSPIPGQEPFAMGRPPLGVLRLSTGDVVSLDRSVLIGRAPKVVAEMAVTDRPHVVKVPSPQRDVSRNHVEVVLEGWHVLVRDLGTTNGTTVALPGEQPIRLRANDQQVLEPGSVVSLADEVSFMFDPGTA